MGLFRLWLAIVVYVDHLGFGTLPRELLPLEGIIAVKSFYIISGFLIQLILAEKYGPGTEGWKRRFWASRALRIYPLYWLVMLASVAFVAVTGLYPHYYPHFIPEHHHMPSDIRHYQIVFQLQDSLLAKIWYIVAHITVVGIDISEQFMFSLSQHQFVWWQNTTPFVNYLWGPNFFVVEQAWSLGLELWFYLLAPFILIRRSPLVLGVAAASWWLNGYLHKTGVFVDGVIFAELYMFLAGALACRIYLAFFKNSTINWMPLSLILLVALFAYSLYYQSFHFSYKDFVFYGMVTFSLPFLFKSFSRSKGDRFLGDMCYPVYLVHFLTRALAMAYHGGRYYDVTMAMHVFTLSFAVLAVLFIERPIDGFRHRRFGGAVHKAEPA